MLKALLSFYGGCWRYYAPWPWNEGNTRVIGLATAVFALGHLFCVLGLVLYVEARRELLWPAVTGTIITRDTTLSECPRIRREHILFFWRIWRDIWPEDEDRRCVRVAIAYSYPVPGSEHPLTHRETHVLRVGSDEASTRLPSYREGDTVEVRYNRRNHARSTLTADVEDLISGSASLLIVGFAFLVSSMLCAGLSRLGRKE
jgi:hypothetical protein